MFGKKKSHDMPQPQRDPDGIIRGVQPGAGRIFWLARSTDVSGVSGTGVVAEGVRFSDGTAVIRWLVGEHQSTVVWPDIESVVAVHGHNGATQIVWSD